MAMSFIGKPISLISHSDVRYRGILAGIDPAASTIQLSNVYSMGTETRRPPAEFIPPVQEPYQYIIFRASEVKDLAVDEPAATPQRPRNVHDDPAVLGASAPPPTATAANSYNFANGQQAASYAASAKQQQPQARQGPQQAQPSASTQTGNARNQAPRSRRTNSVHTATASLETVERAIGEMRITTQHPGRGRRGGGPQAREIKIPVTDFDFQGSNAKFEKKKPGEDGEADANANEGGEGDAANAAKEKEKAAYDPQKSFFDSLSSSSGQRGNPAGIAQGPRRGGGMGRNRREEERERNVATFGEPGGVGLMGPGAYVGGWGGYGRRGGRPRRGHPHRGTPATVSRA